MTRPVPGGGCLPPASLRLISWNVFRNYRAAAVAQSLRRLVATHRPDVLLIQEAPVYDASHFADLDAFEGYRALYTPVHEIAVPRPRYRFRSTGQLILTRHPFAATDVLELPALPRRIRRMARGADTVTRNVPYVRFRICGGGTLGVYNIHLENRTSPAGRLRQVGPLFEAMRRQADDCVVVGGDFNTFLSARFETSLRRFEAAGFTNLFHAVGPRWRPRLDYFMVRGAVRARGVQLRGRGSDHQPIMAVLELPTAS